MSGSKHGPRPRVVDDTGSRVVELAELVLPGPELASVRCALLDLLPDLRALRAFETAPAGRDGLARGAQAELAAPAGSQDGRSRSAGNREPDSAAVCEAPALPGSLDSTEAAEAQRPDGQPADADAQRAARWLGELEREEIEGALDDLLAVYLGCLLPACSFATWRLEPERAEPAWHVLSHAAARGRRVPGLPAPLESPAQIAERLLAARWPEAEAPELQRVANRSTAARGSSDAASARAERAARAERELWRRRTTWASVGAGALEPLDVEPGLLDPALGQAALTLRLDEVQRWLDLGKVGRARALLESEGAAALEPQLARMAAYVAALEGDLERCSELLRSSGSVAPLPHRLVELAAGEPRFARALGLRPSDLARLEADRQLERERGAALPSGQRPGLAEDAGPDIARLGAARAGVFALGPAAEAWCVAHWAAPALRGSIAAWVGSMDGACREAQRSEHRLVARVERVVMHAVPGERLEGCEPSARALLLLPVPDVRGEAAGWLRVEFEHHLLPSRATQRALVERYRTAVLERVEAAGVGGAAASGEGQRVFSHPLGAARGRLQPAPVERCDPRSRCVRDLWSELSIKLGRRRWYLLERAADENWSVLDSDGLALEDWGARPGAGRALERSLRTATPIAFEEEGPEESLGVHHGARSGLVLPIGPAAEPLAVVLLESGRRRDLGARDLELLAPRFAALAESYARAGFRVWHREHFDEDLLGELLHAGSLASLEALARSSSPLRIAGPAGSGKSRLARWLHRLGPEGADAAGFIEVDARRSFERLPAGARTVYVRAADRASSLVQEQLLDAVRGSRGNDSRPGGAGDPAEGGLEPRWIFGCGPAEAVAGDGAGGRADSVGRGSSSGSGRARPAELHPELERLLGRLSLPVPALAESRALLDELIDLLLLRCARTERLEPCRLSDAARALLWRQPWRANVRELEAMLLKLCLLRPGAQIELGHVHEVAAAFRLPLLKRLPSKRPPRGALEAAIESTRLGTGRINKTGAARYLGWDPDTFQLRAEQLGLL